MTSLPSGRRQARWWPGGRAPREGQARCESIRANETRPEPIDGTARHTTEQPRATARTPAQPRHSRPAGARRARARARGAPAVAGRASRGAATGGLARLRPPPAALAPSGGAARRAIQQTVPRARSWGRGRAAAHVMGTAGRGARGAVGRSSRPHPARRSPAAIAMITGRPARSLPRVLHELGRPLRARSASKRCGHPRKPGRSAMGGALPGRVGRAAAGGRRARERRLSPAGHGRSGSRRQTGDPETTPPKAAAVPGSSRAGAALCLGRIAC